MARVSVHKMILLRDTHYHARAFDEMERAISSMTSRPIVFNAHNTTAPPGSILYNTERLERVYGWQSIYEGHTVWEISKSQLTLYNPCPAITVTHAPMGYHPSMECLSWSLQSEKPVDILFFGSLNPRRLHILHQLSKAGLNVVVPPDYETRDALIEKSKLILNIHYYGDHTTEFSEVPRLSHVAANGVPFLSELSLDDADYPWLPEGCLYGDICEKTISMLKDPEALARLGTQTREAFQRCPWVLPTT